MTDHFEILQNIGDGYSSEVFSAMDKKTNVRIALKIMFEDNSDLLLQEINILKSLKTHQNIVKYHSHGINFIALELCQSVDLHDYLRLSGAFSETTARHFFKQMIEGVKHCHEHEVCHRDLKPQNVLMDEEFNVKIADFGYATE